jgi:hypothetical protein
MFLRGLAGTSTDDPDKTTRAARNGGATANSVGSYQGDTYQLHNHAASAGNESAHRHNYWDIYWTEAQSVGTANGISTFTAVANGHGANGGDGDNVGWNIARNSEPGSAHTHSVSVSNNGGNESRPRNVYVLYLIKY